MEQFALPGEGWIVSHIIHDDQDAEELLVVLLLLELDDLVLGLDDVLQGFGVVVVEVDGLLLWCSAPSSPSRYTASRGPRWHPCRCWG